MKKLRRSFQHLTRSSRRGFSALGSFVKDSFASFWLNIPLRGTRKSKSKSGKLGKNGGFFSIPGSAHFTRSSRNEIPDMKSLSGISGFTLIEMLVVSTLILIFSAVVMIGYSSASKSSRDKQREKDIRQVQLALEQYYETYNNYPVANSMANLLSNSTFTEYLQNSKVQDPINTGVYKYSISSNGTTYQLSYTRESDQVQVNVNTLGH